MSWRYAPAHLHLVFRTWRPGRRHDDDMETSVPTVPALPTVEADAGHDWRAAGDAWGSHANDWACFFEHYSLDVLLALSAQLGVGPGTNLLDIACGSGLAARVATGIGATVAGIDAATELVDFARGRTPKADLRVGTMFELPWADATFDVAWSINGIWGGCEAALFEAFRVLRPGGRIGISFWGLGPPLDLRPCFKIFAAHSPAPHARSMRELNNIAKPGVVEAMLAAAGFVVGVREQRTSVVEWPDPEIAWRAIASVGPAVPALQGSDEAGVKREILTALEPCRDERGVYRFRNDLHFVVATKSRG
jgi:SAM-dependent methyltransferase